MGKIVEPIVGRRTPDMRWEVDPMSSSQQARAIEAGLSRHQMIKIRLRDDIDQLVASAVTRVRPHLKEIRENGELTYIPPDLKWYDRHSRRHHHNEEDKIRISKEVVEVPFVRAVVLLRDAPEGFGYLVEEVDKNEVAAPPKPKRKRAPRKRKTTTKKTEPKTDLPLPSET